MSFLVDIYFVEIVMYTCIKVYIIILGLPNYLKKEASSTSKLTMKKGSKGKKKEKQSIYWWALVRVSDRDPYATSLLRVKQ